MTLRRILAVIVAGSAAAPAPADPTQKLRARGAEVFYADEDLRAAAARAGLKPLPEKKRKMPSADAPAFDWCDVIVPTHVHFNPTPTCWAYAAVGAFEWNWAIRNGLPATPGFAVQPVLDRTKKASGGTGEEAFAELLKHGTADWDNYPTTGRPGPIPAKTKTPYRAIGYGPVEPTGRPTDRQIKQALLDHGPVTASVSATPAFRAYRGGVFREGVTGTPPAGSEQHLVVIVGWDDRRGAGGAWHIQNSWDSNWGDGGAMWIEYGSNGIGRAAAWVRAQSNFYPLPPTAHATVPGAAPFPRWPTSRVVTLAKPPAAAPLTPAEAAGRLGDRVAVRFTVTGVGINRADGYVELYSAPTWRADGCIIARVLADGLSKFPGGTPEKVLDHYRGKEVTIRGSVQANPTDAGNRPLIEVAEPGRITVTTPTAE